jgi:hypothetical protein
MPMRAHKVFILGIAHIMKVSNIHTECQLPVSMPYIVWCITLSRLMVRAALLRVWPNNFNVKLTYRGTERVLHSSHIHYNTQFTLNINFLSSCIIQMTLKGHGAWGPRVLTHNLNFTFILHKHTYSP